MASPASQNTRSSSRAVDRLDFLISAALATLSALLGWQFSGGSHTDWHAPLLYRSDAILHLIFIKRLIDGHGYWLNDLAGYPFGSGLYDFPGSDGASLVALWALGKSTGSAALAENIYYALGFPLAALAAYFVLRKLFVSRSASVAFSLLFTLLPFHFLRLGHLYYTWYFTVPIFIWYCLRITDSAVPRLRERRLGEWAIHFAILVVSASLGVYYAFFGAILIGLSGVYVFMRDRLLGALAHAAVLGSFIALGVIINVTPNLAYFSDHGRSANVAQRNAGESELYGLKIAQLLLPRPGHRSQSLARGAQNYADAFPLVNENATASLGIIGSLGFLWLLYAVLVRQEASSQTDRISRQLGFLVVSLLLIATIGGFSALFAQFATSLIRAWNRCSIFIAFMSLAGLALLFDKLWLRRRPAATMVAAGVLAVVGVWDQTAPFDTVALKSTQNEYRADSEFISLLEDRLPSGSAIYQLPYMSFPEAPHQYELGSYDLGKGYLHSDKLRWSFGVTAGRNGDDFYEALSQLPIATQVELLSYMNFRGIYVDRRGLKDHGAALDAEIREATGSEPIVQPGGQVAFYAIEPRDLLNSRPFSPQAEKFRSTYGLEMRAGEVHLVASSPFEIDFTHSTASQVKSSSGLHRPESFGTWSFGPKVTLRLKKTLPSEFMLQLKALAFGPNVGLPATIQIGGTTHTFVLGSDLQQIDLKFIVAKNTDTITITVPRPISPSQLGINNDARVIGLGLATLKVLPIER